MRGKLLFIESVASNRTILPTLVGQTVGSAELGPAEPYLGGEQQRNKAAYHF